MRALHVLETLAAGGVETTFLNVLRHFPAGTRGRADRHDVLALRGGALETEYRAAAAHVYIQSPRAWGALLAEGDYDVIYVLFERAAVELLPRAAATSTARIVYGKNYDFSGQWRSTEGFTWSTDDALMTAADGVTFTTAALAAAYRDNASRGLVLGKAADVSPLLTLPPAGADVPHRILAIANPTPRKRLGDLIEALARVKAAVPDAELRIIGHGDPAEVTRLCALAESLGLGASVTLPGGTRDVRAELARARVVALSSASEGVPTALLEGMAAARPIVTTDCGHVHSIVDDGVEGFVVPVGDVPALARRLTALLEAPDVARAMGTRGRTRATPHAVESVAARLSAYLHDVAGAH
ncbi:MAG: glycosyltransferase [Vicinamibacterales bacterium]